MIKINLSKGAAPVAGSGSVGIESANEQQLVRQGGIKLAVLLLGPLLLWVYQNQILLPDKLNELNAKSKQLNDLRTKNEKAKSSVAEMKKFEESKAKLQTQIDSIELLRRQRMREVRVLDLLQREIPERIWLTKLDVNGDKMTVKGIAANKNDIASFMDSVTKSALTGEVALVGSNEKVLEGNTLNEFIFSCNLNQSDSASSSNGGRQ